MGLQSVTLTSFVNAVGYRLIPSKFPPIDLYEDVASADELDAVYAVEALTNPRLVEQVGRLGLVPKEDWLVGIPHCSYVMAAFTHVSPNGARFTNGFFGGYYCAASINTAIKETVYHMERVLGYTNEGPQRVQMRALFARFNAQLVDIRNEPYLSSSLYHPTAYADAQAFGVTQQQASQEGIVYRSVRHEGHDCYVLFKPRLVSEVHQTAHYDYCWDGEAISNVLKLSMLLE